MFCRSLSFQRGVAYAFPYREMKGRPKKKEKQDHRFLLLSGRDRSCPLHRTLLGMPHGPMTESTAALLESEALFLQLFARGL